MKLYDYTPEFKMTEEEREMYESLIGLAKSLNVANGIAILNGLHSVKAIDDNDYKESLLILAKREKYDFIN